MKIKQNKRTRPQNCNKFDSDASLNFIKTTYKRTKLSDNSEKSNFRMSKASYDD